MIDIRKEHYRVGVAIVIQKQGYEGMKATLLSVGDDGVLAYLWESPIEDPVPLKWGDFILDREPRQKLAKEV